MLAVAELLKTGALRPIVEASFPLEQAAKAHQLGETGRVTGKVVLTVHCTGRIPHWSAHVWAVESFYGLFIADG